MVLKIIMVLVVTGLGISISGCAVKKQGVLGEANVRTFSETYRRAKKARSAVIEEAVPASMKMLPDTGYVKPYLPVVIPPEVLKVWVPAHVAVQDKQVLVSGHWSFVMLKEAEWYITSEFVQGLSIPVKVPSAPQKEE